MASIFANLSSSSAADLDNDGDMDPITLSQTDDIIYWYENRLLGVEDYQDIKISLYPNPVKDVLVIESPIAIQKVVVYNILGSKLFEITENFKEASMASLPKGLFLVEIHTENGSMTEKVMKE